MSDCVYVSEQPFEDKGSTVLVVACSGHATLPYVREFLDRHLKLPDGTYNLLAVPGGAQFVVLSEYLPKFAWVGQKWLGFAVEKLKVRRIILIAHEGCSWYGDERFVPALLHRLGHGDVAMKDHPRSDLKGISATLRASMPMAAVEAYFIEKSPGGHLSFTLEA